MSQTTQFGVYHLADNPSAYQPVRSNNFIFMISGLNDLLLSNASDIFDENANSNAAEILSFSATEFDAPNFTQGKIEVQRGNSKLKFAGLPSFSDGSLTINDFAGANGKSILQAWQNCSYNVIDDTIPSSDKYKLDATVLEYLPDNTLIRYWELKGCWVSGLSETKWSSNNGEKKQVQATITYDWAIPHLPEDLLESN